jgi:hypothetical protein
MVAVTAGAEQMMMTWCRRSADEGEMVAMTADAAMLMKAKWWRWRPAQ